MTDTTMGGLPSLEDVIPEQLRVVGIAIRREAIAAALLVALPTLLTAAVLLVPALRTTVDPGGELGALDLDPADGWGVVAAVLAVLAPLAVWKSERLFDDSQLWYLPVSHARHTLIKVTAGWAWLMTFVAASVAWLGLLVLVSGGTLGVEETRLVVLDLTAARAGEAGAIESMVWVTEWWQWLIPFTAATAAYLVGSALLLGLRHPWWWLAGTLLFFVVTGAISEEFRVEWLNDAWERVMWTLLVHPMGLDTLTTGGLESLTTAVPVPGGEPGDWLGVWHELPSLGRWASATALWTALGAVGLGAAVARHRER